MSYVWGAAVGARFGPVYIRRWQDSERPAVLAALLVVLLLALSFFAAVGVFALAVDDGRSATPVVAGGFLLAAAGALAAIAETLSRWWWRGRRSGTTVLTPAPSGAPSTAVLRSRAALVTPWTNALTLTAWCVVMATATELPWGWTVAVALLGLVVSTRLWALVLGRAVAGGVYLTAEAVELRWGVLRTTVPWTELEQTYPAHPVGRSLERGIPRTPGTTERRSFPVQMPTGALDRTSADVVEVPMTYLALRAPWVWAWVGLVIRSPHLRRHLGTARSLEWHVEPESRPG